MMISYKKQEGEINDYGKLLFENHHGPLLNAKFEYTVRKYLRMQGFIDYVVVPIPY